jgi:hypothetical protein
MKIDWEDIAVKILVGIVILVQVGFTLYAAQSMTDTEKTNLIIELQQEQQQE